MAKKARSSMSKDEIRHKILEYFHSARMKARGLSGLKLTIRKIYSDLKKMGIDRGDAVRNLSYLIETGWIIEEIEEYPIPGKRFSGKKKTYRISSDGIDLFEKSSKFQRASKLTGINIGNVKNSVVIFGNNNYVRAEFREIFDTLETLGKQIRLTNELTDQEKMNFQAEVDTIQSQLKKEKPNKDILKSAWSTLKENLPAISGVVALIGQIEPLIGGLI